MNEPVPGWIDWSPETGVTWGPADTPFLETNLADTMPVARRAQTVAPKRRVAQRICLHGGCTTILSRWNREDFCGAHARYHGTVPVPA